MKLLKEIVFSCILLFISHASFSQFEIGLKGGIHSYNVTDLVDLQLQNDDFDFSLTPLEAEYGIQFGLYSRVSFLGIYVEPAVMLNSSKFSYQLNASDLPNAIKEETFLNLDLPLLVGIRVLRILRLQAGPVGHLTLDSSSELFDINGYSQTFEDLEIGYQAGIGLDLWKLRFDVLYENDLNNFGDHITIDGQQFSFSDRVSRVVFNLGFKF